MLITEQALFQMPTDQELQFPAMAVLQSYVNGYDAKMKANDVSEGRAAFRLFYQVEGMSDEDWQFFEKAGVKLNTQPRPIVKPDMVFDLTEDRVASMVTSGKHVAQIYGVITGIGCPPWPITRQLHPKAGGLMMWGTNDTTFTDCMLQEADKVVLIDESTLLDAKDNEWTGVVGVSSRLTYLACSMGLPTIEILPEGRSVGYLSKWGMKLWRCIEHRDNLEGKVQQAMDNIHKVLRYLAMKELYARGVRKTS